METDIGNPIDYIPHKEEEKHEDDSSPIDEEQYYYQQPPQQYFQPPTYQMPMEKTDFFSSVDKSVWIIAFAVFLLGFFMGKTMQPVILRYAWVSGKVARLTFNWNGITHTITLH